MRVIGIIWWALLFIPQFIVGNIIARILSPIACLFVIRAPHYTTVKRYGKIYQLLNRDRLVWWLTWLDTDDNATDEFHYGMYSKKFVSQYYYDTHCFYRWYCRMRWLQRNSAYTFTRKFFGLNADSKLAWHYEGKSIIKGRTVNIGWKSHKNISRLMYAGRII